MSRGTIRIIIILATLVLVGLVVTQIFWVGKAYDLQERQFDYEVTNALKNVVKSIQEHREDSTVLVDPVKQVNNNYFIVNVVDTLNPDYLQSLLVREFQQQEINVKFEYSIYDCFQDSVVFRKVIAINKAEISKLAPPINWNNDGHYFGVFFPEKNKQIINRMGFWLFSSLMLITVCIFFAYTISIILKQKRLSEVRTDFINNMTHELKTPISTISLSSEVLLDPNISENPERLYNYAKIIHTENNRLKNQVERVLQIATVDKKNIKLQKKEIDVHELIKNLTHSFAVIIKEKDGTVQTSLTAKKHTLFADDVHLTNIIHNLLDNANKYTLKAPEISVATRNKDNSIEIIVSDNGIGIAKQNLKYIFDKFYRVPTGDVHNVKGFGLGLNYVKTITEAHGGEIKVTSSLNKGSTFIISLPLAKT